MLSDLETGLGLDIVLALQSSRSDLLDALALLLHHLGGDVVYLVSLSLIFWSLSRHLGIRLLFGLAVAGITSGLLKILFHTPRPYQVSDLVVPIVEQASFGLPSGHVMLATVIWGYAAFYIKKPWLSVVVGIYVLTMGWSRMYLGVHYPQDTLGGIVFGLILLALYARYVNDVAGWWSQLKPPLHVILLIAMTSIATLVFWTDNDVLPVVGVLTGAVIGIELELHTGRFISAGTTNQRVMRYIIGIGLTILLFVILQTLFGALAAEGDRLYPILRVLRYSLVTILALYIWPQTAVQAGLATKVES